MKAALIAFSLVTLTCTLAHSHTDLTTVQVQELLDAGANVIVLDVRESWEYCDSLYTPPGHIIGAINMPWNSGYLQDHYTELDPGDSTIVVCRSGGRSHAAANFLDGENFWNVFDMLGGMNAWQYETENCTPVSVPGPEPVKAVLSLRPPSPNPFSFGTEIAYAIPAGQGRVSLTLTIYDSLWRPVTRAVDDTQGPGVFRMAWDGRDHLDRQVPSGVYFCRLSWNGGARTQRLVLLRLDAAT